MAKKKNILNNIFSNRQREVIAIILTFIAGISIIGIFCYDPYSDKSTVLDGLFINSLGEKLYFIMGYNAICIPIIFIMISYILFFKKKINDYRMIFLKVIIFFVLGATLFGLKYNDLNINPAENNFYEKLFNGGFVGLILADFVIQYLTILYAKILFLIVSILALTWIFNISNYDLFITIIDFLKFLILKIAKRVKELYLIIFKRIKQIFKSNVNKKVKFDLKSEESDTDTQISNIDKKVGINELDQEYNIDLNDNDSISQDSNLDSNDLIHNENIIIEDEIKVEEGNIDSELKKKSKFLDYKLPTIEFLKEPIDINLHSEEDLRKKADELLYAINSFAVDCEIKKISAGPVITLFEIEPAEGVRVNKITNLAEDLSRIMGGKRVRVLDNVPGTRSVGIEVPNDEPAIVYLKSIINSRVYIENKSKLKIALGKTTTGDAYVFDLCKMPHLLVAGATGAGKSVCINTIIISILYNAKPDEVKFILMDPKKVELSTYKSLVGYHLITAEKFDEYVMTNAENSVGILQSAIFEMEKRFQIFSEARVRNIEEYHNKMLHNEELENIPYIVVIIDELADLMMTSGRAIEEPITRLAQKARAVGIHLIVATQRPSVDVITGLIKSNFPARISFQVSSKVDSRTIIDQIGAEKLLGRGDMLFLLPGSAAPIRLHNAFIELPEIEDIMNHIASQPKPDEIRLPEIKKMNEDKNSEFKIDDSSDELLKEAAKLVVDHQQASVSLLQRKFRIGYSRAGRLVDELESLGIVSPYNGSKAREVLVDNNYLIDVFGE